MFYALVCGWDVLWHIKTRETPVPLMQANFGGIFCQCETRRWRLLPAQARLAAAGGLRRRAAEPHEAIVDSNRTRKKQRVRRGAQARERARVLRREGQGRARGGVRVHAGRAGLLRPARSRTTSRRRISMLSPDVFRSKPAMWDRLCSGVSAGRLHGGSGCS